MKWTQALGWSRALTKSGHEASARFGTRGFWPVCAGDAKCVRRNDRGRGGWRRWHSDIGAGRRDLFPPRPTATTSTTSSFQSSFPALAASARHHFLYQNIEDHNRSFPLMSWKKQAYVQIDWVGNFTAAAGACIYDGGAWPMRMQTITYYVAEPTINIVHQDILTPKGVSYVASRGPSEFEGKEFIGSTDLWFRAHPHARRSGCGAPLRSRLL